MAGDYGALNVRVTAMTGPMEKAIAAAATRAGQAAAKNLSTAIGKATKAAGLTAGRNISTAVGKATKTAGLAAGKNLSVPIGKAGKLAGDAAGKSISTAVGKATKAAGQAAAKNISDPIGKAGKVAGEVAGKNIVSSVGRASQIAGQNAAKNIVGPIGKATQVAGQAAAKNIGGSIDRVTRAAGAAAGRNIAAPVERASQGAAQRMSASFRGAMGSISNSVQGLGAAFGRLGSVASAAFTPVTNAARNFGTTAAAGFAVGGAAVGAFTGSVLKSGFSFNVLYSSARIAMKTILGSTKAADKMMQDLYQFSLKSPFDLETFVAATQQMLGFGVAAKDVIPSLDAIQDAVAGTAGDAVKLRAIVLTMSQIRAAGKITGVDLMQMGQRGIQAAKLIGDQMGKTSEEITEMITAGTLSADVALNALVKGMKKTYGGAAANLKTMWEGAANRIKASMTAVGSAIAEPFVSKKGGGLAITFANKLADSFRSLVPVVTPFADAIGKKLAPAMDRASKFLDRVTASVKGFKITGAQAAQMLDDFAGSVKKVATQFGPLIAVVGAFSFGALARSLGPIGAAFGAIVPGPLIAGLGTLIVMSPKAQSALAGLGKSLSVVASTAMDKLGPAFEKLNTALGDFVSEAVGAFDKILVAAGPGLTELAQAMVTNLVPVLERITPQLSKLAAEAGPGLGDLASSLAKILNTIGPALPPLAEFVVLLFRITNVLPFTNLLLQMSNDLLTGLMYVVSGLAAGFMKVLPYIVTFSRSLWTMFSGAMRAIRDAVSSGTGAVVSYFAGLGPRVMGSIRGLLPALLSFGRQMIASLARGISSAWGQVTSALGGLKGRVTSAFQGAGSLLVGIGRSIVEGLASGIRAAAGEALAAIRSVVNQIRTLAGAILDSKSPSKVMRDEVGRTIPAGIAVGIRGGKQDVHNALAEVLDFTPTRPRPAFGRAVAGTALVGAAAAPGRTVNVYPKENQSEMEIARQVDRILGWTAAGG